MLLMKRGESSLRERTSFSSIESSLAFLINVAALLQCTDDSRPLFSKFSLSSFQSDTDMRKDILSAK